MIRQILGWLLVAIVVIAVIAWIMSGGFSRALTYARSLTQFNSYLTVGATSSGQEFRLPGQPDFSNTVGDTLHTETGYVDTYTPSVNDGTYQPDYGPQDAAGFSNTPDPRTFGSPSPYAGHVIFVTHQASGDVHTEYVGIQSSPGNGSPLSLAGWSIQSAITGASIKLPQASEVFVQGALNTSGPTQLEPGATAFIVSGISPVGVSFHINRCTGYLSQYERFVPAIAPACPSSIEIPAVQSMPSCLEYFNSIPACHFPGGVGAQSPNVPEQCRMIAAEYLSYNGCVGTFKNMPGFTLPEWRLYLGISSAVWRSSHDTIRLLDNAGRIVDVLSY